jgi:drug/metabolite transporter (DMT)-like permease
VIGFTGVLVLLGPWHGLGGPSLLGTLLCLGPGICYGFAFTYTRRHLSGSGASLTSLAGAQVMLATLQLAVVTPFFSSAPSHITLKVWGSILALGALGTGLAYVLSYDIIGRAGATTASLVTYVVPLFATFFGVVLLGESLTWNEPVGALVIIAGAAVSQGLVRRATVTA